MISFSGKKLKANQTAPAVFTVEATLLMTIILPVLLAMIYLGYLDHDRGVLQASASETAALADNSAPDPNRSSKLKMHASSLGKDAVLVTKDLKASFSLNKNFVQVSYSGSMKVPGLLLQLFGSENLSSGRSCSRKLFHPTDTIRKIRGLEYLSDRLTSRQEGKP